MAKMFNYEADHIHDMVHPKLLTDSSHYVAECKDILLTEATPNYPKLTDYESEWLYFYEYEYEPGTPIDLEYKTLEFLGKGVVQNTIPFKYKRAILKGETLVNVIDKPYILSDDTQDRCKDFILKSSIKSNTEYRIIYDVETNAKKVYTGFLTDSSTWSNTTEISSTKGFLKLNSGDKPNYYRFVVPNGNTLTVNSIMIIEYQEGIENCNIPYFEGMKSVQMPVLTTSGKNLLENLEWEINKRLLSNGKVDVHNGTNTSSYINVSNLDVITFSGFSKGAHCLYDENKNLIGERSTSSDMTIEVSGAYYIRVAINNTKDFSKPQMEVGSSATSYEPYKSNIVSVNEKVELRGIGDVKDELNLLTGELTQRIGVIVFDGDENWIGSTIDSSGTFMRFYTTVKDAYFNEQGSDMLCDRFTIISHANWNKPIEGIHSKATSIYINIPTSKLESNDISGFKKWLSSNPVTVCYKLATESIKTVDINGRLIKPYEGTNHYYTSSDTIPPSCLISVPIESTGEKTLNDISQED